MFFLNTFPLAEHTQLFLFNYQFKRLGKNPSIIFHSTIKLMCWEHSYYYQLKFPNLKVQYIILNNLVKL